MDELAIVRERLRRQHLAGERLDAPVDVVRRLGAVQAQEHAEALWSVALRVRGETDAATVQAALDRGEIIRTHVLRPTWHYVAAADLRWMTRLTAPRIQARNARRYAELELDGGTLARSHAAIARALEPGEPLTRRELVAALEAAGVSTAGQRIAHILLHAELELLICSGPRRGAHHTYVLVDRLLGAEGPPLGREAALAELARRYFECRGPATARDLCWWATLTAAEAREAIELAGVDPGTDGAPAGDPSGLLLIPTYDELLVAYRDFRVVLAPGAPVEALLGRLVVADGVALGTWRRTLRAREVAVEVALAGPPDADLLEQLEAVAARFGRFVGLPARLELAQG